MAASALGTLTWEEFLASAKEFMRISTRLNDGWTVKTVQGVEEPDSFYLEKKMIVPINVDVEDDFVKSYEDDFVKSYEDDFVKSYEEDMSIDRSTLIEPPKQFLTYEYHIVYSIAYSTPVLYFTAWKQDGRLLPLEAIWDKMNTSNQLLSTELKWSTVTQQIHPVLQRPYYQLHPCRTSDLMKETLSTFNTMGNQFFNYLICWLSTVGNIVGLKISTEYAKT